MSTGPFAAHARPGVRRVPALLTVAALVVLLVAALGAKGVITAPTADGSVIQGAGAPAGLGVGIGTTRTPAPPATSVTPTGSSASPTVPSPTAGADETSTTAADGAIDPADSAESAAEAGTVARSVFVAALGIFFDALAEPAQDSGTPAPLDKSMIPRATPGPDDTALPAGSGTGKRIVYAITAQRVWLVEADGQVARTYRVSGRLDRPPAGTYHVYSKSRTAVSYDYKETMEYMVRFAHGNTAAIGFHDIPRLKSGAEVQTIEQLGQPLSAGCVRQADPDAIALWNWAPVGTAVVVVP